MKALNWFLGAGQQIQMAIGIALITTIGLLIAAQAGTVWYFTGQLDKAALEQQATADKLARCEGESAAHKVVLKTQSEAVTAMKEEADKRVAESEARAKQAEASARTAYRTADERAKSKPLDPDQCVSMRLRAERSIREFQAKERGQ